MLLSPADGDWTGVRKNFHMISSTKLGPISTPIFAGLTLSSLTASRLLATNSSKTLVSSDLYSWVTETSNQVLIADDGDGTITLSTPQDIHTGASPTFVGLTLTGKLDVGSQASPIDVTNTRQYGFEIHYSGNNYNVTGIRSRAQLVTTDTSASAQGAVLQAANNDGINAGVLNGALIEAIGKSGSTAATISTMRGALVGAEWGAFDTVTALRTLHVRTHSLNNAGVGSFGTGYGIYIENEAVGGNGQALDAGIYFKGTNLSAGNKAFTYGIDFRGGTYATAEIIFKDGTPFSSDTYQPLDADLTALAALSSTGLVARTGGATYAERTITGTANQITVSNGDGVAGNPTLSTPQDIHTGATPTFSTITVGDAGVKIETDSGGYYLSLASTGLGEANSELEFDLVNNEQDVTIALSAASITLGDWFDQSVETTASPTFAGVSIANYIIAERAGLILDFQNQDSGEIAIIELFAKDGDRSDSVSINLFGLGTPASITNIEYLQLGWSLGGRFEIKTVKSGSGGDQDLAIYTGANTSQLVLASATDDISMSGDLGVTGEVSAEHLKSTDDIEVVDRIFHSGDEDTYIDFSEDLIRVFVGNAHMIDLSYGPIPPTRYFDFVPVGLGNFQLFRLSPQGTTAEFTLAGYKTGDALRTLEVGVGVDADDTVSFDGLSNYYFNGKIAFTQTDLNEYVASLNDGYMDYGATTAHRFNNDIVLPKTSGKGIKIDTATPTFGWRDLLGETTTRNIGATKPSFEAYNGAILQYRFSDGDLEHYDFHIPHDYVAGTDIHLHIHWSQISTTNTGGTIDFKYFAVYSKGHNQAAFTGTPITDTFTSADAGTTQYQQHITETIISGASATAALFDRDDLEPDGVILLTLEMDSNDLTDSVGVTDPFILFVDIHYQSTNIATKDKVPDFYT